MGNASTRRTGRARFLYALGGIALLGAGAAALFVGRGRLPAVPPVPEVARATGPGRPVIFVGLDGGDWELLDRYAAAGVMPNLAALIREGAGGTLLSLHPPLSPLVWTTMMTGVSPLEHRILDFTRRRPGDGREEPITSDERRAPAVWNMATYGGKRVAVFGLWATYPAEEVNGLVVSDRAFPILLAEVEAAPRLVHPPHRLEWVRKAWQKAEGSVGFSELRSYLPWLDEGELGRLVGGADAYAHPVSALPPHPCGDTPAPRAGYGLDPS